MKALYALYPDADSAQRAVHSLRRVAPRLRIPTDGIAVLSSEPYGEHEFGLREAKTFMPWVAALGGVLGGLSGYGLTTVTQLLFPIPTGGMAIVPLYTDAIILYELTMLGAILATFLTLLATTRIPDWRRHLYDPEISDGKVLVGVLDPAVNSRAELERVLLEAGAERVKEFSSP